MQKYLSPALWGAVVIFGIYVALQYAKLHSGDKKLDGKFIEIASKKRDATILVKYGSGISNKIQSKLNLSVCPASSKEVKIDMQLTHKGDIAQQPKLVQSSGDAACDNAILKALQMAKPFELPQDHPQELELLLKPMRLNFDPHH